MLQFYLLSVVANALAGTALLMATQGQKTPNLREFFQRQYVRLSVGGVAIAVGVLKIFVRAPFDTVPVAGDLLPALMGIAIGLALLAESWTGRGQQAADVQQKVSNLANFYRLPLGFAALAVSVVHFLVPGAVIL
jgi:hypothetical protein